ncbi:hypothetical protein TPHA_0D04570 [Tetrapisispora phaffii CBS 4417]|uniref:DNA ligase n=1 Tax=Tetrapisispora phaffii (strain ATCC 24235 / CBS 4417 / NBRC 1672 / NRRL Y-8282 / UCD 70-5) TaxID=1071381 RepID=G8BS16_TETPH|nr:hypothetical protein TPHA_0D04570 [Tetrapisispora phaffii CBS 4417]CCE63091.1 hypothetical protein TPHA_0D04570 [Tetrapisispora phaffii CBS 4417]
MAIGRLQTTIFRQLSYCRPFVSSLRFGTASLLYTRTMSNSLEPSKKQATLARFFTSMGKKTPPAVEVATKQESPENHVDKKRKVEVHPSQSVGASEKAESPPDQTKSTVLYSEVCNLFQQIEETSSRLAIIKLCSEFFIRVIKNNPSDIIIVAYLFINRLGPDYEPGLELGLGENLLIKTISEAYGKSIKQIKLELKETGDLGTIARDARNIQPTMFKPKPLTISDVFNNLKKIASATGKDSQLRKIKLIKQMLSASKGLEAKFLIRSLESKLRIGLAEKTVLISLSKALLLHEHWKEKGESKFDEEDVESMDLIEQAEAKLREAHCQVPNYEIVINLCLQDGILNIDKTCTLRPGIPLKPMLAKPTKAITEVLNAFQGKEFISEYKYDGERAQVHLLEGGEMRIYSRNGENMTERYPELDVKDFLCVVKAITNDQEGENAIQPVKDIILDCEVVAWDVEQKKILPFQVLTTRKRKNVDLKDVKVRVCLFAFDLLYLNNEGMINKSLRERQEILRKVTVLVPGEFQYATSLITSDMDELQTFLDQAVKNSCEGLMVKMLDGEESHYEPSKRSRNWLKLKKDYLDGVGDSLDLVVMGAYFGKGKRTGSYGGFLLGCYNEDTQEFETCCKIGTGFSDEMLGNLHTLLQPTEIDNPPMTYIYDSSAEPDVWFQAKVLFEVLTADLSLSPVYKAGNSRYDKGISLRFPRFLRIREDKDVTDGTTSEDIIEFYESQSHIQN